MNTYKELFCRYEETALHVGVPEVENAEARFAEQLKKLGEVVDADTLNELDQTCGVIARAYELQGFAFAQQVYDNKEEMLPSGKSDMIDIFKKSISELYGPEVLEIREAGEGPLTPEQISGLWSVVNYRFEHQLPTVTYTDKKSPELCKALEVPGYEMLALEIVCRLWEMGVCASSVPAPAPAAEAEAVSD